MIFLSTAEAEKSWISSIEDSLGIIGNIQTLYSVLVVIALIILFCVCVMGFTKKVSAESIKQVAVFKKNRKYIPELFTELNSNLENLRYFVFCNIWKRRIIREFNRQFNNAQGKEIAQMLSNDLLTQKLPYRTKVDDLMIAIAKRRVS